MSLLKKLKPDTSTRCGKVAECPRCGFEEAEHYSANYIACARCDKGAVPNPVKPEQTQPWAMRVWYRCGTCRSQQMHTLDEVANGQMCLSCRGPLRLMP